MDERISCAIVHRTQYLTLLKVCFSPFIIEFIILDAQQYHTEET